MVQSCLGSTAAIDEVSAQPQAATILMIDDDAAMRMLFERYLTAFGYNPIVARDGDEALRIASETPEIQLVILDLVMPGLSAPKLVEALAALLPDAQILVCSGHPENALPRLGIEMKMTAFMQKPCRPLELKQRLSEMLTAR